MFRAAGAVIFTAMAIGLFPAAGEMMVINDDEGYAVGAADAHEDVSVDIIYRDTPGSEWSLEAARELAGELYDRYGYAARLLPATEAVSAISAEDEKGNTVGGAIVIGHTELSETDYTDAYYSVGADGFRTYFNSRGDLIIEAFGSDGAAAGIDRFLSNYNGDSNSAVVVDDNGRGMADINAVLSGYSNFRMETEETDVGSITISKNSLGERQNVRALVLAAPDADSHSVAAIEALLDDTDPDLVIFTGDLSAGADDRAELREYWAAIAAPLNSRGIGWSFIGADESADADPYSSGLPAVMQNEVVASTDGCIGRGDGSLIEIGMGEAVGGIWLIGERGEAALGAAEALISGSDTADATLCIVTTGDVGNPDEDDDTAEVFDRLAAAGVSVIVDCAGNGETDIASGSVTVAAAGSIGYESPGLGGRFAYNNSLRGGVLLTFSRNEDGSGIKADVEYILVSELSN